MKNTKIISIVHHWRICLLPMLVICSAAEARLPAAKAQQATQEQLAKHILDTTGVKGGLIVHIGCADGRLTVALRANDSYLVHGLDKDAQDIDQARKYIHSLGLEGPVSVDTFDGRKGSLLLATDKTTGQMLAEFKLPSSPVFDGMIAANGKLFLALKNGSVVCFDAKK